MELLDFTAHYSEDIMYSHMHFTSVGDYSVKTHTHEIFEFLFFEKGNALYTVEGKTYSLSRNNLIITRPGDRHSITIENNSVYKRYDVLFDENNLFPDVESFISKDIDVINFDGNNTVIQIFKKMNFYSEHFDSEELRKILFNLVEEIFYNIKISENVQDYSENQYIRKALEYIEENLTKNIDIPSLCRKLYISKSYLHKLFAKHMQITPKKYILSKRLNLAQRALRAGEKPTDVYTQCGFSDYSAFYRDYVKRFKTSPSNEINRNISHEILSWFENVIYGQIYEFTE